MKIIKSILLGLVVGVCAVFIYCCTFLWMLGSFDIYDLRIVFDATPDDLVFAVLNIVVQTLSSLPMAITAFIFMFIVKFKADTLFLLMSNSVLFGMYCFINYFVISSGAFDGDMVFGSLITGLVPCGLLSLSLILPNKWRKKREINQH